MKSAMLPMRGLVLFLAISAWPLLAANLKLYTTDGEFQMVREYQVVGDRVKFYSLDRSEWEEVPVSIVDLKRTEAESASKKAVSDRQDKAFAEEAEAARAERADIARIPQDSGVYRIENGTVRTIPVADFTVRTAKGRAIFQAVSRLPFVGGKSTVELPGEFSQNVVHGEERPEFIFRMDKEESFAIVKVKSQKTVRVVEQIETDPITKENVETREPVPVFSKQLNGDNLYKIWPQEPLPKGEYAVMEYLDGKVEMRIWDFRID